MFRYIIQEKNNNSKQLSFFTQETIITAVGYYLPTAKSVEYEFQGEWIKSEKYGRQLQVTSYEPIIPDTKQGIVGFLSSGLIKGIGVKTARAIVDKFGLDAIKIIETNPKQLTEIKGISEKKLEKILSSYEANRALKSVVTFLAPYNIGINKIMRIYKFFGPATVSIIQENPFELCRINGFGFKTADEIAKKINFLPNDERRIKAAANYILEDSQLSGHLFLEKRDFRNRLITLLNEGFDIPCVIQKEADNAVVNMINEGTLCTDTDSIYTKKCFEAEGLTAQKIVDVLLAEKKHIIPSEQDIREVEQSLNIRLAEKQKEAVIMCLESGFSIITGGPGTGKTTTLKTILALYRKYVNGDVLLMAPTGKAARRMEESTHIPASTIHSALCLSADEDTDEEDIKDSGRKDPITNTLIVVDEFSMVDMFLAHSLFQRIGKGSQILLVGDPDQLPSVGPGNVFRELIESRVIPVTVLDVVYRQAETSPIIKNAAKINTGDYSLEYSDEFSLIRSTSDEDAKKKIITSYSEAIKNYGMDNVQVLSPFRTKGEICVNQLNEEIQNLVNPPSKNKKEFQYGKRTFREGDRIIQIKNNKYASNGDVGVLVAIEKDEDDELVFVIDFSANRRVFYAKTNLEYLDLAYAVTVHKSQGSEYSVVVLAMTNSFYIMLKRNLLYTAVTRAKNKVVIIGQEKAVLTAIHKNDIDKRNTKLGEKIKKSISYILDKEVC